MDIREALSQIYAIQAGLAITEPVARSVEKVWHYRPPGRAVITDTPCFLNVWSAPEVEFRSSLMMASFEVNMQLVVYDADTDQAADIASAFYPEIVDAFSENVKLGLSGWLVRRLRGDGARGSGSTLTVFEEYSESGGKTYVGLDLTLEVVKVKGATHAAGAAP